MERSLVLEALKFISSLLANPLYGLTFHRFKLILVMMADQKSGRLRGITLSFCQLISTSLRFIMLYLKLHIFILAALT